MIDNGGANDETMQALRRLGWVATRAELVAATSRRALDRAVSDGAIVRIGHGRYGFPSQHTAREAAARVNGVMSHLSAALYWEWKVKWEPDRPVVTVPRWRKLSDKRRKGIDVRWSNLDEKDIVRGRVTSQERTAIDCVVSLPYEEALSVLDSALRQGLVTKDALMARAAGLPPQLRKRAERVIRAADPRAENPFESVTRAIAEEVPLLAVEPQAYVEGIGHPDLYDRRLGIVIECDSFEFHKERADIMRDCERYNSCALLRLVAIRFSWDHTMLRPDYVRKTLTGIAALRAGLLAEVGLRAT